MDRPRPLEIEDLLEAHQTAVWRYLRFLGAADDQAEDLLQETFLAVWRRPFEQRSAAATRQYLCTVARNLFLMALRRGRVRLEFKTADEADLAWAQFGGDGGQAFVEALRDCLEELSERQREVVRLQYFERLPRERVAAALGLGAEGVKTLIRRVRSGLRDCVRGKVG